MKKTGIDKATKRAAAATTALESANAATNYDEFEAAWAQFLVAGNAVHTILEVAARDCPTSRQWFGQKKKIQRKDPLLCYMHQARNADEHGIEPTTTLEPGGLSIGATGAGVHIKSLTIDERGHLSVDATPIGDGRMLVSVSPARPRLNIVCDNRYGTEFEPPTFHLDEPLQNTSPLAVGSIWLNYLEGLLLEASERADRTRTA